MKITIHFILLFIYVQCTAQKQFVVDEHAELRTIIGNFTAIKVSSAINLYLSKSENIAVAVSAGNPKLNSAIKTDVVNGVLTITYDGGNNWRSRNKVNVYVACKNVEQIIATNAANVIVAGILDVALLDIKLSSASNFKGQVKVDELTLRCSSASDVKLSGYAKSMIVECSGASDVHAYELFTDTAVVKTSGASDVYLTVNQLLTATASGASNILYKGSASLKEAQSSGASTISRKE